MHAIPGTGQHAVPGRHPRVRLYLVHSAPLPPRRHSAGDDWLLGAILASLGGFLVAFAFAVHPVLKMA